MQPVKIERNGVEAEVVDRYLKDFLADGWSVIGEAAPQDSQINLSLELLAAQKEAEDAEKALAESNAKLEEEKLAVDEGKSNKK